jgi:hypothetical protein
LALAVKMGMLHATANFDVGELQVGVQDFLVCIEMFIAAGVCYPSHIHITSISLLN